MNFNELDLEQIETGESEYKYVVPVFTFSDDYINSEKKPDKAWGKYAKEFKTDGKNLTIADDVDIDRDDENEPFKDKQKVTVTNLESIASFTEKQIDSLVFGLREKRNDDSVVHVFDESVKKNITTEDIDAGLTRENIEDAYNEVVQIIKKQVEEKKRKAEEREREEEQKAREAEMKRQEEERQAQAQAEMENDEVPQLQNSEMVDYEGDTADDDVPVEENQPQSQIFDEIQYLRDELFVAIDNAIPYVDFSNIVTENELLNLDEMSDDVFAEIKHVTAQMIATNRENRLAILDSKRNEYVQILYNELKNKVLERYTDTNNLLNYTSEYSDFFNEYQEITDKYKKSREQIENEHQDIFAKHEQAYNSERERIGEEARNKAIAEFDRENRGRTERMVTAEKDKRYEEVNDEYENQIESLRNDVNLEYDRRYYSIVDDIVNAYQSQIDDKSQLIDETIRDVSEQTNNYTQQRIAEYEKRIQEISEQRFMNQKDLDNSKQVEIDKLNLERENQDKSIAQLEASLDNLKKDMSVKDSDHDEAIRSLKTEISEARAERDRASRQLEIAQIENKELSERNQQLYKDQLDSKNDALDVSQKSKGLKPVHVEHKDNQDSGKMTNKVKGAIASVVTVGLLATGASVYDTHETNSTNERIQEMKSADSATNTNSTEQLEKEGKDTDKAKDMSDFKKGDKAEINIKENGKDKKVKAEVVEIDGDNVYVEYKDDLYQLEDK